MTASSIGALVVLDTNGKLCGIISERDVVRSVSRRAAVPDLEVRHAMTRDVACASPSDEVQSALHRMTLGRFRHLPVMVGDDLVGIVSIGDLVKAQLREYEGLIRTLESELLDVAR
jgi:CBS domain-containing protein